MKHISKKTWFTLSIAIVALSAVFAWKKPVHKEKSSHIIVDRLVNQLVCGFCVRSDNSGKRFPHGILKGYSPKAHVAMRDTKRGGKDEYTLASSHKIVMGRQGKQRNDKYRPAGGDFHP